MTDYSWFDAEISKAKWSTFHVLKRNMMSQDLANLGFKEGDLPEDYLAFLLKYGESYLYRRLSSRSHWISVLAPRLLAKDTTLPMLLIGGDGVDGDTYLIQEDDGIYIAYGKRPRKIADNFAEWLRKSVKRAKKNYKKWEWDLVCRPPAPFSEVEQRISDAYALYTFSKAGITDNWDTLVEIQNGSPINIAWIKVGVLAPSFRGAVDVNVSGIAPGRGAVLPVNCYKEWLNPSDVQLFQLPTPTPEDRFAYKALRILNEPPDEKGKST